MGKMMNRGVALALGAGLAAACVGTVNAEADVQTGLSDVQQVTDMVLAQAAALDRVKLERVAIGHSITIESLPMVEGIEVDLDLERMKVFSDNAVFLLDNEPQPLPEVASFRGRVAGDAESYAFVTVSDAGLQGYVTLGDGTLFAISTGNVMDEDGNVRDWQGTDIRITDQTFVEAQPRPFQTCNTFVHPGDLVDIEPTDVTARGDDSFLGSSSCRIAEVALDTDWEFSNEVFSGNGTAAANYATSLMSAVSEIYVREVNTRLEISFLRTWSNNSDPYGQGQGDPADQLRNHWRSQQTGVQRDIVHMLTGQNPSYGGVALGLGILCNNNFGYSVSAYLDGSFPYPLQDFRFNNWDPVVVAHELGHCFNAPHTHDYNPPIDRCGIDCSGNRTSTIMSYCHVCSGGLTNIALSFHPTNRARMQSYVDNNAGCLGFDNAGSATAENDNGQTFISLPVTIDVLANDSGGNCAATSIASFDATSANGGTLQLLAAGSSVGVPSRESLRYFPPAGFTGNDTFSYTVSGGDAGTVTVNVEALRTPDAPTPDTAGLETDYFLLLNNPDSVEDMAGLTPFLEGVTTDLNFPATNGAFAGSGVGDFVGAIFEGSFRAIFPAAYTFSLTSDDGSRLYIGDDLVIDNDGLHGEETVEATVGLGQGYHRFRVEYFERQGSSTLIAEYRTNFSPTNAIVGGALLGHATAPVNCNAADIAAPFGELNIDDVLAFLDAFATSDPVADVAAPTGSFDIDDVLAFLDAFANGCP